MSSIDYHYDDMTQAHSVTSKPYIDTSTPIAKVPNFAYEMTWGPLKTTRPTRVQIIESAKAHKCYAEDDLLNALEQDGLIDDEFATMPIREIEEMLNEIGKWTAARGEDGTWNASAHRVAADGTDLMGVVTNQPTYDVAVHQLARQVFEWLARR